VRPTVLINEWTRRDRDLAKALLLHEASIGPCGFPHDETTGDLEGWFEVNDETVCWACFARDQYTTEHRETGPPDGAIVRIIDTRHVEE
jgi:hypothetical protein